MRRDPHKKDTHVNWKKIQTQETQTYGMRFTYTETISFFLTWSLRDCPGPVRDTPNPDTETGHPACEKKSKQSSFLVKQGCSLTNQYGISTLTFDGRPAWVKTVSKNSYSIQKKHYPTFVGWHVSSGYQVPTIKSPWLPRNVAPDRNGAPLQARGGELLRATGSRPKSADFSFCFHFFRICSVAVTLSSRYIPTATDLENWKPATETKIHQKKIHKSKVLLSLLFKSYFFQKNN